MSKDQRLDSPSDIYNFLQSLENKGNFEISFKPDKDRRQEGN